MEHQNQNRTPGRGSAVKGPYLCELPRRSAAAPEREAAASAAPKTAPAEPEKKAATAVPEKKPEPQTPQPSAPAQKPASQPPEYSTESSVLAVVFLHAAAAAVWYFSPIIFENAEMDRLTLAMGVLLLGDLLSLLAPVLGGLLLGGVSFLVLTWLLSILEEFTGFLGKSSSAEVGLLFFAGYFGLIAFVVISFVISVKIGRRATDLGRKIRARLSARKR